MNKEEIQSKLEAIAYNRTTAFCYNDYIECPTGTCPKCGSDDLMRLLPNFGCEYGISWVIEEILRSELEIANLDEAFEDSIRSCYPEETQVGWMTFNTVELMKSQDPVSWQLARDEYIDSLESDDQIVSFDNGSNYYWVHDLESLWEV